MLAAAMLQLPPECLGSHSSFLGIHAQFQQPAKVYRDVQELLDLDPSNRTLTQAVSMMPEKGGLIPPPTTARYFRKAIIPFAATEAATDACEVLLIYFLGGPHRMTLNRDVGGSMMGINLSDFPGLDGCLAHMSVDSVLGALQKIVRIQMNPPNHIAKQPGEPSLIQAPSQDSLRSDGARARR
jgi:hypothetical protein